MHRLAWLLLSGCAWAVMMFLLFEREIRPYFEYRQPPSYRTMLGRASEPEIERRAIFLGTEQVGESERLTEPLPEGGYRLRSRTLMDMRLLMPVEVPVETRTFLSSDLRVDEEYRLTRFDVTGGMQGVNLAARGERRGDKLRVAYEIMLLKGEQLMDFPEDATLADYFMPYTGGSGLAVGKKWKSRMMDLENLLSLKGGREMAFSEVYAQVVDRDLTKGLGRQVYAFKIEVRKEPTQELPSYTLWVDDEGVVVRQVMKINKYPCEIRLVERRALFPGELPDYPWKVLPPR